MPRRSIACVALMVVTLVLVGSGTARAQLSDTTTFLVQVSNEYRVVPNVTYHVADVHENKLDTLAGGGLRDQLGDLRHVAKPRAVEDRAVGMTIVIVKDVRDRRAERSRRAHPRCSGTGYR